MDRELIKRRVVSLTNNVKRLSEEARIKNEIRQLQENQRYASRVRRQDLESRPSISDSVSSVNSLFSRAKGTNFKARKNIKVGRSSYVPPRLL